MSPGRMDANPKPLSRLALCVQLRHLDATGRKRHNRKRPVRPVASRMSPWTRKPCRGKGLGFASMRPEGGRGMLDLDAIFGPEKKPAEHKPAAPPQPGSGDLAGADASLAEALALLD